MITAIADEIARYCPTPDLSDDCAHIAPGTALVSADALVEGIHFDRQHDTDEQIGRQAAVANLSDIAASGGRPSWLVWSLILDVNCGVETVRGLTRGFAQVAGRYGVSIVGGNLTRGSGPMTLAVTVGGALVGDAPLLRSGALPGDRLWVTGPLGDAALGVMSADAEAHAARHAWRPHVAEAEALVKWGACRAAIDISDGLLLDASRIGAASGVGIEIDRAAVPVSDLYRARRAEGPVGDPLTGGEDYVLLFAAPAEAQPPLKCWAVGRCVTKVGFWLDGNPVKPVGYDHFQAQ